MKHILFPILTPILGLWQLLLLHAAWGIVNLITLLWNGSTVPLYRVVNAKHKQQDAAWRHIVLGYMDGTYGWMSYLLSYEAAFEYKGRIRLVNFTHLKDGLIEEEVVNGYRG